MPEMVHLDLFSGIGGFAYAADQVWDCEHIFCDNDAFCREVLKKHWPNSEIYNDIRAITDTRREYGRQGGSEGTQGQASVRGGTAEETKRPWGVDLLTGGFPCQPFSQAGNRGGTSDDRYLWPEMLRVIRLTQPRWVIAENVRGLLTLEGGVVFETVCTDLEAAGYEVQPLIIPAVAVDAPHRRDRVWFIGHTKHDGLDGTEDREGNPEGSDRDSQRTDELRQPKGADSLREGTPNASSPGLEGRRGVEQTNSESKRHSRGSGWGRDEDWLEVATQFCSVDDGLPVELDGFKLTKAGNRKEQLKAYGNAIVPQVAIEIMRGIADA